MHIVKRTGHPNRVMRDYYSVLGFTVSQKAYKIKFTTENTI